MIKEQKDDSGSVRPTIANAMLPAVLSWQTFRKTRKPEIRQVQDSSLGMTYTVEPTMRYAGWYCAGHINNSNDRGIPHSIYGKPKEEVVNWLKENPEYHKYKECVYYVWHVRREYGTVMIDVFLK